MGQLHHKMVMEMQLRNLSPNTIEDYTRQMVGYCKYFGRSPAELGDTEIKEYLHHLLVVRELSWSSVNVCYCALRFFYVKVMKYPWNVENIPRPKTGTILPEILSDNELIRLFNVLTNFKHRIILMTIYSAGLRVGEVTRLKPAHIDSDRMLIRVEQSKGRKDRYTLLSASLLPELRTYYQQFRPRTWLFEGRTPGKAITVETVQRIFKKAREAAGIRKKASVHTLRHCFATHLMENGTDIFRIKEFMGHRSIQTTLRYIHVRREYLRQAASPLDILLER
jgi:integrase/recombinase XerD